jgi:hypothetical protein
VFNWLAMLSSLAWVMTLILWQHSWVATDTLWLARGGSLYLINLSDGSAEIDRVSGWKQDIRISVGSIGGEQSNPTVPLVALVNSMATTSDGYIAQIQSGHGYVWQEHKPSPLLPIGAIRFGLSPLPFLLLILPLIWMISFVHDRRLRRQRRQAGQCVECGYDLRATPQRCPECGTVPARTNKIIAN